MAVVVVVVVVFVVVVVVIVAVVGRTLCYVVVGWASLHPDGE
jgi:hypothetical protein